MSKPISVNKTKPTEIKINLKKIKLNKAITKLKEVANEFNKLTNLTEDHSMHFNKIKKLLHEVKENKFDLSVNEKVYDLFMNGEEKNIAESVDKMLNEECKSNDKRKEIFNKFIEQLEEEENCVNLINQD